jgi:transcriptional regulator with XRE-family HTH domain
MSTEIFKFIQRGWNMSDIIERILVLLKENNMTAKRLTELLNVNHSTITEWKTGKTKPSIEHIIKIAEIFDVSTDYILTGVDRDALKKDNLIGACELDGSEVKSTTEEDALIKLRANEALTKRIEEMFRELAQKGE